MWWEIKNHLKVKDNNLFVGGIKATSLAKKYGTPLYVYNGDRIIENYRRIKNSFKKYSKKYSTDFRIYFAVKANNALSILKLLAKEGAGADTTSPHEVRIAIKSGIKKEKIIFTGTSVSDEDLEEIIKYGVLVNIDSFSQMRRLSKILKSKGKENFPISIRWNPGKGAGRHEKIITAGKYVKFGIPENKIINAFKEAKKLELKPIALHQHIGSNWKGKDVDIFLETVDKTIRIAERLEKLKIDLKFIDFGGGPGIRYKGGEKEFPIEKYAKGIYEKMENSKLEEKEVGIAIEPGRYIVGDSGILLTEINTVEEKTIPIIGVNAGFNTFIRPAMYGGYQEVVICNRADKKPRKEFMIAGNVCESGDVFNENRFTLRKLPIPKEKEILAILNAGAYGFAMASNFVLRPFPAEVMILNGKDYLIRKREKFRDMLKNQIQIVK